jgi:hypothetical protein
VEGGKLPLNQVFFVLFRASESKPETNPTLESYPKTTKNARKTVVAE